MTVIAIIAGTRPEFIKLGPVAAELRALHVPLAIISTGQHTDLLAGTPVETDLRDGICLGLKSDGDLLRWAATAERELKITLRASPPTLVVVQGDTMSAVAGARAAHQLRIPIAHVEAGVRSHDLFEPWPEEAYRVEIDRLATYRYAPTTTAIANLEAEELTGIVTGNSGVSAITRYSTVVPVGAHPYLFVTLHRREWLMGKTFREVLNALSRATVQVIWPMHPAVRAQAGDWLSNLAANLQIVLPVPYPQSLKLLAYSTGCLTDSGGVQEEAATLGVPCAVLRNVIDRPESIDAGVARRFGTTGVGVELAINMLVNQELPRHPTDCFGDPTAASQIAQHLAEIACTGLTAK